MTRKRSLAHFASFFRGRDGGRGCGKKPRHGGTYFRFFFYFA